MLGRWLQSLVRLRQFLYRGIYLLAYLTLGLFDDGPYFILHRTQVTFDLCPLLGEPVFYLLGWDQRQRQRTATGLSGSDRIAGGGAEVMRTPADG